MAKKKPKDLKGYYRLLKINPGAAGEEIQLAYAMTKSTATGPQLRRLEQAYAVLRDPKQRAAYDKEGLPTFQFLKSPVTLVVAVVILVASFVLLWLPEIRLRGKNFSAGESLVEIRTGRPFGEVVRFEQQHTFPEGPVGPAYLVKVGGTASERWFPAIDLQATCNSLGASGR